jgi:aminoglycoside 6'-N-acetyltransferase
VKLRPAASADIPLLEYWDTKPHVQSATGDDDVADWSAELTADPRWQQVLIAEDAGRAVGVVQIIDPRNEVTHYWGDVDPDLRAIDIWIGEEADLGRGLGTQMMELAIAMCFDPPEVTGILIDPLQSNSRAQRFYARMGFEVVGPRVFDTDHCLVMRLDRNHWQQSSQA